MIRRTGWVAIALLLAGAVRAADGPGPEEIARAVKQLADDDFEVREKASEFLWRAGRRAEAAVREAARSDDAETKLRAGRILDKFRWGIFPDTPAEVVALIEKYRSGDPAGRGAVVKGLLDKGEAGYDALQRLVTAEPDDAARRAVRNVIAAEAGRAVPSLVAEERYDTLERLLETAAATREPGAVRDYVACLMLRGRLDDRIAHYRKVAGGAGAAAEEMLAYLLRAKGDLAGAGAAARRSGNAALLETVLFLRRDWDALAKESGNHHEQVEARLGFRLSYQRRAGRADDAARTAADLAALARAKPEGEGTVWWSAKSLFLNDLTDEAMAILPHGHQEGIMVEILAAQLRYREAFALLDTATAKEKKGLHRLEAQRARLLYELGRSEEAVKILGRLAASIRPDDDYWEQIPVLQGLAEVGRRDEALKVAARLITDPKARKNPGVFWAIFPQRGQEAETWWHGLRETEPSTAAEAAAFRVRDVLNGKVSGRDFIDLLGRVRVAAKKGAPDEAERRLLALADACAALGHAAPARECLADAVACRGSALALGRLADHDADAGRWKDAAEGYRKAREKDPTRPVPVALEGWALSRAGSAAKWPAALERARWLALGDPEKHYELAEALAKHGLNTEARREYEMNLRLALGDSWYLGNALDHAADEALARKDYATAADFAELDMLTVIHPGTFYLDDRSFVRSPHRVHFYRARGLLDAGKVDEALKEVRACQRLLPGDIDVPIVLVPALEKLGRRKEADEVFAAVFKVYDGLTREHPGWAMGHNRLAWLCARCRRKTDEALTHAEKATALVPSEASYLDTLAEVHFQRGDKDRAVALMKKCMELRPKNEFYRKQLRRYEAGDPKEAVPE